MGHEGIDVDGEELRKRATCSLVQMGGRSWRTVSLKKSYMHVGWEGIELRVMKEEARLNWVGLDACGDS